MADGALGSHGDRSRGADATPASAEEERAGAPRTAQQRLENSVVLPDAIFAIDEDKRVVAWKRACEIMTGVKKEAVLGRSDYACAEPFFGERRPILIDLLDAPSSAA